MVFGYGFKDNPTIILTIPVFLEEGIYARSVGAIILVNNNIWRS
jgi:hypothetical protein